MKVTSTGRGLWVATSFLLLLGTSWGLQAQSPITISPSAPLRLSLDAAVQAALTNNTSIQLAAQSEVQSGLAVRERRAALLPSFETTAQYTNETVNLGSIGLQINGLPVPSKVGPFGTANAQVQFSEPVVDLALIRLYQAAKRSNSATERNTAALRLKVAALVGRLYFAVKRAEALVSSAQAQVVLDEKLLELAQTRRTSGAGIGLDVTRASSRLASNRSQLLQNQTDVRIAQYQLLRALGQRLDASLELTDSLSAGSFAAGELDAAIGTALDTRPELRASSLRIAASRTTEAAAHAERFPTIRSFGTYGAVNAAGATVTTDTVGVELRIPLWDGNATAARRGIAASQLREDEIRDRDLRAEIEMEVRIAFASLTAAREQTAASTAALDLAQAELDQAEVRFEARVATQSDVIIGQTNLAEARTAQVDSWFELRVAEIEFKRATGVTF
jgi:outer membrane protein TolC